MNDDFPTPPPRSLPPEVRDRLRAKLYRDIAGQDRSRVDRARGPLAIAAGVAVLAAGAMIVAQSVNGGTDNPAPGNPTTTVSPPLRPVDMEMANSELDRCFGAVQQAGKTELFPPRAQWEPVHQGFYGPVNVTGAIGGGMVFFCETTYTSATISDPNALPTPVEGSITSALLSTKLGTIAGVVDLSWPQPWLEAERDEQVFVPLNVQGGLFMTHGRGKTSNSSSYRVSAEDPRRTQARWQDLPAPPPAAVSIVDRPPPTPDRTSERGLKVDECLKAADQKFGVIDMQSWQPGAVLDVGNTRVAAMRNEFGFATCWTVNGEPGFSNYVAEPEVINKGVTVSLGSSVEVEGGYVVAGVLPAAAERIEARTGTGQLLTVDARNNTFVVHVPLHDGKDVRAKVFDSTNRVIFEGPLTN